jgi:hypothetical protein
MTLPDLVKSLILEIAVPGVGLTTCLVFVDAESLLLLQILVKKGLQKDVINGISKFNTTAGLITLDLLGIQHGFHPAENTV